MFNLIQGDCLEKMQTIPDSFIDLVVTSPPYDNLRDYGKDFTSWGPHIWKPIIAELYQLLKKGGVCVWVVGDATIKGSETGTSFRQALYAIEIGFNLHDTMIWHKPNPVPTQSTRYELAFEYMFIFSKGRPAATNIIRIPAVSQGTRKKHRARKNAHLDNNEGYYTYAKEKVKHNVWNDIAIGGKGGHPAAFPLQLAEDHIKSWSNEGDTILDPFMGSGTTGAACGHLNRRFTGIELDPEYFKIAYDRIYEAYGGDLLN